ncbi:NmrA family NAD(P)-binding protein [Anditalea andensis]|uniref:NmrA family protein n=1 Tax=Anditalea andensis TaxID=1048983 RepID=A0A074L0B3_9BACT|nr:NmrA family NAD(P)-binding protein [Anditalea andensis]KEO75656.1 NmrA family protein [Anditalea andensis]
MKKIIVVGGTGNLGKRIIKELIKRDVTVCALVRSYTDTEKIMALEKTGAKVEKVDFNSIEAISKASRGATCLVSALAGLGDVIEGLQSNIVEGAIRAGVPRFIPSDFCTDYNHLVPGENRNFDLRRNFKNFIDTRPIQVSSVFNGAFADILRYNTPLLNLKEKSIGYWGNKADWKMDFTTMDDTAAFTAEVALDDAAPRDLQIASFQVSPNSLRHDLKQITGEEYRLHQLSDLEEFSRFIKEQRAQYPAGEQELYAKWQQGQYMYSMFSTQHTQLSNGLYQNLTWTSSLGFIQTLVK